jgi:competence protein ComEA
MELGTAQYRGIAILCSAICFVVGGAIVYLTTRTTPSTPIVIHTPPPTPTSRPTPTSAPIRIHVAGAVDRPGVYELPPSSIVQEAIDAAGGPTSDADPDCINLAQELQDHQQVYVPHQGEANPPPPISGGESGGGGLVNINTATATELETLPRIGPATAQKVIAYREDNGPFETIEDIKNVPTIGEATFEGLKDLIAVGP